MFSNPSKFKGDSLPVENVSWIDAMEYCKRFSEKYGVKARLPYEAEWEYACRGGTTTYFYWGRDCNNGNYYDYACNNYGNAFSWNTDNSNEKTHAVGKKKPNTYGLYDMSGNVEERCMDWFSNNYYENSPSDNPTGPSEGKYHVMRGGAFYNSLDVLSSTRRSLDFYSHHVDMYTIVEDSNELAGFRIVVEVIN